LGGTLPQITSFASGSGEFQLWNRQLRGQERYCAGRILFSHKLNSLNEPMFNASDVAIRAGCYLIVAKTFLDLIRE
jgi:hypothetical protein